MVKAEILKRAKDVERKYLIADGCYILGVLEKGVTVYNQQVRAHNLAWALWELKRTDIKNVAIIGGGIGGVTFAACVLSIFDKSTKITIFERLSDLHPIQQGCDTRWLHPRIYGWPEYGSRAPGASLPVLNWSEGRASDVARSTLNEFARCCDAFDPSSERLCVYLNLKNIQLDVPSRRISFIGDRAVRSGPFFRIDHSEGGSNDYDCVVLATGFGLEPGVHDFSVNSYWRNDQYAQPKLNGIQHRYLVSGFGDGGIVDLCRLTIERYRQDTIIYEIFGNRLEKFEEIFREDLGVDIETVDLYKLLTAYESDWLRQPLKMISQRLRKDTYAVFHASGRDGKISEFSELFSNNSSILNRLMLYLLYRCGAFALRYGDLGDAISEFGISPENVICRHGANMFENLRTIIKDFDRHETTLQSIKTKRGQSAHRLWEPGAFRSVNNH